MKLTPALYGHYVDPVGSMWVWCADGHDQNNAKHVCAACSNTDEESQLQHMHSTAHVQYLCQQMTCTDLGTQHLHKDPAVLPEERLEPQFECCLNSDDLLWFPVKQS